MLRKDVRVLRPEGTKIYRQRNCEYVYYVIGSEYKKDKQYVIEKRVCIGKMVDEENMIPNDNFYQYFEIEGGNEEDPPRFSDALQVRAPALIFKIMEDLKISELLESIHGKEDADLIKDLISYMIIRGTSTMQHYADFVWGHLINAQKQWNDCKISEFFKEEIEYAQTELFVSKWNELQPEHSDIYVSYDSTNMNTKAQGIEMAEYGHAKEDSDVPQVNISYAVNHSDATPLFYEMYPGSIVDNTQCTHMVDRAKEYGYKNVGIILDRGYFSMVNIRYFDENNYDFLMMVKNNSTVVADKIKEAHLPLLTKAKYYLPEHDVYGLTKEGTLGDSSAVRYFHIYYDNIRASQERNEYMKQLMKKEKHLQKKVDEKIRRKEEMVSYEKLFKLKYDNNGYLESYTKKDREIQKEIDRLGFFVIVTSKEMTASEALDIYRKRDNVEKIFRMLKTGLEYDTFRVHSQESLESKTYVMFIASIVRNHIFQGLKKLTEKENDKKSYTVPAAISELEKITIVKNSKDLYIRRYGLTKKQKNILGQFNVTESYINKLAENMNERI